MDHVALCKHRAAPRNPWRFCALQGKLAKGLYGKAQPLCLLVQKAAGARCADRVHGEVPDALALQGYELGVLAPHLDHGLHVGVELLHCVCLGHYLVHRVYAHGVRDNASGRACDRKGDSLALRDDLFKECEGALQRAPKMWPVEAVELHPVWVNNNHLDADAPSVESNVEHDLHSPPS